MDLGRRTGRYRPESTFSRIRAVDANRDAIGAGVQQTGRQHEGMRLVNTAGARPLERAGAAEGCAIDEHFRLHGGCRQIERLSG